MNIYKDKVILIIGGQNLIDAAFVQHFLDGAAREVRILGSSETAIQSLREELNLEPGSLNQKLCFFVGDMTDNAYLEEAVTGADYVLFIPSIPRPFDCEVAPAVTTITFLETITGVIHVATDCKVEKIVVISPNRQEPLEKMPDMLAALMETVVVAEGRYLGKNSAVTICCARIKGHLGELADFAFEKADNCDLLMKTNDRIQCIPCEHFDLLSSYNDIQFN